MQAATFYNQQGLNLFYRTWLPSEEPKARLVISHGYAEHSGRYKHVAEFLVEQGFAVYALDYRGHGESEGARAIIKHFGEFVTDLCSFLEQVQATAPKKLFLLGHSMGGTIAFQANLALPKLIDGLLLSAPFIQSADVLSPLFIKLLGIASKLLPNFPIKSLNNQLLARDSTVVEAYKNDPLVYLGKVRARLGKELFDAGYFLLEAAPKLKTPTFIMHGGADKIVLPSGSQEFYELCGAQDKSIEIYQDHYHEILNDFGKETVLANIVKWLDARL